MECAPNDSPRHPCQKSRMENLMNTRLPQQSLHRFSVGGVLKRFEVFNFGSFEFWSVGASSFGVLEVGSWQFCRQFGQNYDPESDVELLQTLYVTSWLYCWLIFATICEHFNIPSQTYNSCRRYTSQLGRMFGRLLSQLFRILWPRVRRIIVADLIRHSLGTFLTTLVTNLGNFRTPV